MMTEDDDVVLRIELLMSACGNLSHWHVLCPLDVGFLPLPWLAHVKQRKSFPTLLKPTDLADANFKVHSGSRQQLSAGTPFLSGLMLSNSAC